MLKLQILTPSKVYYTGDVEMVTLPAIEGEVGILPGHTSMIMELDSGLIKIYQGVKVIHTIFIYNGFVQIDNDEVNVLTDEARDKADVKLEEAMTKIESVTLKLINVEDQDYHKLLERELSIYKKMVEISKEK